jgi:hypothetical protein
MEAALPLTRSDQRDRRILAGMDLELVVVPDCPNEAPAATLLRTAPDDIWLARIPITTTACRIYRNTTGPAGIPDLRLLRRALKRAAAANLQEGGAV